MFEAALFSLTLELYEQTVAQIPRAHARRIKTLDERKHLLEIFLRDTGAERHFFRRALEKPVIVDIAYDQFCRFAILGVEHGLVQLRHQILLKRFLHSDGIKKELALIFRLLGTAGVAARLRHVIAPFFVQRRQLLEFLFEIVICRRFGAVTFFGNQLTRQLLQHWVCLHFLLDQIMQLEQRRLKDEKALLKLRRENLVQAKILRLMHSLSGHTASLRISGRQGKQFGRHGCSGRACPER